VTAKSRPPAGVWLGYHEDWSGMAVFSSELAALRWAVERNAAVTRVPFGVDLREAVKASNTTPKVERTP
jgi:hypothetical protein